MKKLTLLLSLLVSLLFASRSVAETERRWLSDMPDSMRLSQLSIPKAHDAATWRVTALPFYWCQRFNERYLFQLGVRSFDLRLGARCKRTGNRKYEIAHIAFYHADLEVMPYKDEVDGWPTQKQLDGNDIRESEFLIFNIGMEYEKFDETDKGDFAGYSSDLYQRRMVMDSILYTIKDRYGETDLAGKPRFVPFRADMTVAEMRGKIFVFCGKQSLAPADLACYKYRNWVTLNCVESDKDRGAKIIANKPDNETGYIVQSFSRYYSEESTAERDAKNSKTVVDCLLSQEYCEDNRRSSVMADYFQWAEEYFHSKIDMQNTQNIIFDGHLNSWAVWGGLGPHEAACDGFINWGTNRLAYNYIRTTKKPLGIVGFDFCGDNSQGAWGDTLLEEIIRHNYIQKELMTQEQKYIADVILVHVPKTEDETGDGKKAKEKMQELGGYEMVGDSTDGADIIKYNGYIQSLLPSIYPDRMFHDEISGRPTRIFMGVKYTHDPDSALTNLMLVEHATGSIHDDYLNFHKNRYNNGFNPAPDDDIEFWGSRYYQPVKTYDYNTGTGWDGNLTIHTGGTTPFIYLWQEKHPRYNDGDNGGVLTDIVVLRLWDIKNAANLVPYMLMNGTSKEDWSHGAGPDEFEKGNRSLELPEDTYLQFFKHNHNKDGISYNDTVHFSCCTYCGYKFNGHAHTFSGARNEPDYLGISHFAICDDGCGCVSTIAEPCVGPVDSYGFGKCTKCGQDFVEPAKRTADGTYEVSNAGQLYWITRNVPVDDEKLIVKLTSNIRIPDGMQWTPIGTKEKPFMGTFDGQGHTISNMNVSGEQFLGLFGYLNGATVKNLGIVESKIRGTAYVGTIAGHASYSTIENVFCTAEFPIFSGKNTVGAFVGSLDHSYLRNSFFDGEASGRGVLVGSVSDSKINNLYVEKDKYIKLDNYFTAVASSDFENGKLCYLLNEGKTGKDAVWCQRIGDITGNDLYPIPSADTSKVVYAGFEHGKSEPVIFRNNIKELSSYHLAPHNPDSDQKNENHDLNYSVGYTWLDNTNTEEPQVRLDYKCDICKYVDYKNTTIVLDKDATIAATPCVEGLNIYTASLKFNDNAVYNIRCEKVTPAVLGHDFADDGFSCKRCHTELYQPAELVGENTYQISNAGQLYWFSKESQKDESKKSNVILANDIVVNEDMTKDPETLRQWDPICGRNWYHGTFDGQGHTISGLYCKKISDEIPTGLFGTIADGTVKNLGLTNSVFHGSSEWTGSIVGYALAAKLYNIYSDAKITTTSPSHNSLCVGGLAGKIYSIKIRNAYFDGLVEIPEGDFNIVEQHLDHAHNYYVKSKNAKFCEGATVLDDADFTSGKLCYLLNEGKYGADAMWRQNIDASEVDALDDAPCLNKDHQMVIPGKLNGKEYIGATFSNNAYSRKNLNIEDGHDFQIPVELHILDATTYSRNVEGYQWGTICLPFEIKSNTDVQYYTLDATPGSGDLNYVQVEKVEKNTPAIFKKLTDITTLNLSAQGNTITPPAYNDSIRQAGNAFYSLIGTFEKRNVSEDSTLTKRYLLNNNLYMVNKYIVVNPFRVWLENIPRRGEGPTAIEDLIIDANHPDDLMYDTFGHRIAAPQKGQIIIKNGKKQINK